jgi:hypothetical protein
MDNAERRVTAQNDEPALISDDETLEDLLVRAEELRKRVNVAICNYQNICATVLLRRTKNVLSPSCLPI